MGSIRKIIIVLLFSICLLSGCTEEQPYIPQDEPGKIVGLVKPEDTSIRIDLIQGTIIQTTVTDTTSGYFEFDSVAAGTYNLEFYSNNYGKQFLNEVKVNPGQVTTIPDIHLKPYPEQIATFIPVYEEQNFSLSAPIEIQFSTLMDHFSVEQNFLLVPKVNGRFVWQIISGNSKFSFYPDDQYISNYTYVMILPAGTQTSEGDSIAFDFMSYFKTEGVKITTTIPEDGSTFISPQSSIYVYFNSKMDRQSVEQNFSISPQVLGDYKWFDSRRASFQPGKYLASNTEYTITIDANASDIFDNNLLEARSFKFETEPLRIVSNFPTNGATSVNRSSPISITFNTNVNQQSVQNAFSLEPTIDGWIFQWSDQTHFQYAGSARLQPNESYTVTIDSTCSDYDGNLLPSTFSFVFQTGS